MRVVGLCGSLRSGSYNRRLLDLAAAEFPDRTKFEVLEGLSEIPPYNEDLAAPDSVSALRATFAVADAVVVATPEYNGSLPGQLKNVLDWVSRPFPQNCLRGKPAAVIGSSTGIFGAVWAQAEVRKVLSTIGADVVDEELPIGQVDDAFADDGRLRDPNLQAALSRLMDLLLAQVSNRATA